MNEMVEKEARFVQIHSSEIRKAIVGQNSLVERVLVGLLDVEHGYY